LILFFRSRRGFSGFLLSFVHLLYDCLEVIQVLIDDRQLGKRDYFPVVIKLKVGLEV
jgi:hypothetical protein